jgi:D-ornithine 4,5-aminomutase subunit alpha
MGIAGVEARRVVEGCLARGLLGHGAGHVVLRASRAANCSPPEAAVRLASGELWDNVERAFGHETSPS